MEEIKKLLSGANRELLAGSSAREQKQLHGLLQKLGVSHEGGRAPMA